MIFPGPKGRLRRVLAWLAASSLLWSGTRHSALVRECRMFILQQLEYALVLDEFSAVQNRTLGFEKIVVVSTGTSWRIDGLLDAADLTGLDVSIPLQPKWRDTEVQRFQGAHIGPGQTRCWLGHIFALKYAIENRFSSMLIMEDDADWDLAIKKQLHLVAPHIRAVTNSTGSRHGNEHPYGNAWDLLWLGHCGDIVPTTGAVPMHDDTMPEDSLYRENTGEYTLLEQGPQRRVVHISAGPICAYAYAVTASAAEKIYRYVMAGDAVLDNIITADLRRWCQAGFLTCVTVNPELFHHHKKAGETSSEIAVHEGWDPLSAPAPVEYTANIRYSARCNAGSGGILVSCRDEFQGPVPV